MKTRREERRGKSGDCGRQSVFCRRHACRCRGSFSMWDLIVVLFIVIFLGGWVAFAHSGARGRLARCTWNLEKLGGALQAYAGDHNDDMPAAGIDIGGMSMGWDMDVAPYLTASSMGQKSVYEKRQLLQSVRRYFICPSDSVARSNPRSYAMSGRDMDDWPAAADDETGIGLWWDKRTIRILNRPSAQAAAQNPALLPKIKQSLLPEPSDTMSLTEFIRRNNILGNLSSLRIFRVDRVTDYDGDLSGIHFGKFNYLMADGHVELLTLLQTGGEGNPPEGIWTIKAGD